MCKFQSRTYYRGVANLRVIFLNCGRGDGWVGGKGFGPSSRHFVR